MAVLDTPYNSAPFRTLEELGRQRLDEIEHFFISYNQAEGRRFKPLARRGPERAQEAVTVAMIDQPPPRRKAGKPRQRSKA